MEIKHHSFSGRDMFNVVSLYNEHLSGGGRLKNTLGYDSLACTIPTTNISG
jgi:hypothetical protein